MRTAARSALALATPVVSALSVGHLCGCQRHDVVTLYGVSENDAAADERNALDAGTTLSCSEPDLAAQSIGRAESALTVVDRSIVGSPAGYVPDPTLRAQEGLLDVSQRARRAAAWQIAQRVLQPVALVSGTLPLSTPSLPAWQTWHAKDDITRIFRRAYPELSAADRMARTPLSDSAISAASSWNDGSVSDFAEWTADRLAAYQAAVDDASKLAGLGGIYRVAYSPAASSHLLQSYGKVLDCIAQQSSEDALPSTPDAARTTHCGVSPTPPPSCLDGVFSSGAALIKAVWLRADAGIPLAVYDTSAPALARRLSSAGPASWDEADAQADPGPDEIYTLHLPNGNAFRLGGLHIMTKELDHWVWMTLWWSADPDSDFGADRPAALAGPWSHYKLCTAVAFEERDPDPSGGFGSDLPSLGASLSAAYAGPGGPSWCSNPYIENGAGNAATNCIGCHQHAGTGLQTADILADALHFPEHSRRRVRDDFRSDYVFAVSVGDDLGAMFQETEDYYAAAP